MLFGPQSLSNEDIRNNKSIVTQSLLILKIILIKGITPTFISLLHRIYRKLHTSTEPLHSSLYIESLLHHYNHFLNLLQVLKPCLRNSVSHCQLMSVQSG